MLGSPHSRIELRQTALEKRKNIPKLQQQTAAFALTERIAELNIFQNSQHIATYMAHKGEIDPAPLLALAEQLHKQIYLPVIDRKRPGQLCFQAYTASDTLHKNSFGILEPVLDPKRAIEPQKLDLVLLPLLAFDSKGRRLGTGGGYYDQTFAFMHDQVISSPYLLGLAYELQKVAHIEPEPWDVPLHGAATEQGFYSFENKRLTR